MANVGKNETDEEKSVDTRAKGIKKNDRRKRGWASIVVKGHIRGFISEKGM